MILKPIDNAFSCPANGADLDAVLANMFQFNGIKFLQTDTAGAQLNADPYAFFAVNVVNLIRPIAKNTVNRYASANYDCLLTIAKAADASREVSTDSVSGQFDTITREFTSLEFMNTLRSYFTCCGYSVNIVQIKPIWNSTRAVKNVNHSGVEITLTIEI